MEATDTYAWVDYFYCALPLCVFASMFFTRFQYRKVLPEGMWTPKRLYNLRVSLLIQLCYRITFLFLDYDVFDIYTIIPGIMYSMVLLQFLYALLQDFCAQTYLRFFWTLYIIRALFGPVILYLMMVFNDSPVLASEQMQTVPAVYTGMFGVICFFFPPVFSMLSSAYFRSKRLLAQGHDPFPAFRRFPASNIAVALMATCYILIFALTVVRAVLDGAQIDASIRDSNAGQLVLRTGLDLFVVEALPILLLTVFETLRQQPTVSFYWLVLNNPEFDPDRARAIPWRDLKRGRFLARGGHKIVSHARWCTAAVVIAQPIEASDPSMQSTYARKSFNQRLFALYDEAFLLLSLQHPNIISLFGVTVVSHGEQNRLPALVLEAARGSLESKLMEDFASITSSDKLRMMKDISCALTYLHDRGLIHNDIKADNILVAQDGHTLKIADLSSVRTHEFSPSAAAPEMLARHLPPGDIAQAREIAQHQRRMQDTYLQVQWQVAMESIFTSEWPPSSKAADVYSCGLVFCVILTGERCIYDAGNQTLLSLFLLKLTLPPTHYRDHVTGQSGEVLVAAVADSFDEEVGGDILSVVQRCCLSMATQRPSARELLEIISVLDLDDGGPVTSYTDAYAGLNYTTNPMNLSSDYSVNGGPPVTIDCS
eukprot:m.37418 g.37418  ORF g.37418 m.37418 type:complete len:654 (+) comp5445_c0_seq1:39-2000(+)